MENRSVSEPEINVENGIVYYVKPYKTNKLEWVFRHLDCNSIYTEDEPGSKEVYFICYASSKEYNYELYKVWKEKYPKAMLKAAVTTEEVNSIG